MSNVVSLLYVLGEFSDKEMSTGQSKKSVTLFDISICFLPPALSFTFCSQNNLDSSHNPFQKVEFVGVWGMDRPMV